MVRLTPEPTKSEKVKETALSVASVASAKAQNVAHNVMEKTTNDIAPLVAAKADTVKTAAAPHVEHAKTVAAPHVETVKANAAAKADDLRASALVAQEAAAKRAAEARAVAAERAETLREDAAKRREEAVKQAEKANKKAAKKAKKSNKKLDKKATSLLGVSKRQDLSYRAAALRGQAASVAEDKGLTPDHVRDMYNDEFLPHIKELLAAAAAAGVSARAQAGDAAVNAFGHLPPEAQTQVAKVAPALAKKQKKGGRGLMILGAGALAGAGYLFYAEQQKRKAANAQLSEVALADSQAKADDSLTINNPVTNFKHAEDPTVVHSGAAVEAGGPGTAASWSDVNNDGKLTSSDMEGETRASRRENRNH